MRARAFTLVEMLLATALAAMLVVAVLGVTAGLGRGPGGAKVSEPEQGLWQERLVETLRRDLLQARQVEPTAPGGSMVVSYSALDGLELRPADRPVQIQYRLVKVGTLQALWRQQVALDDPSLGQRRSELLALGVQGLEIQVLTLEQPVSKVSGSAPAIPPQPASVRVRVRWQDPKQLALERTLVLR